MAAVEVLEGWNARRAWFSLPWRRRSEIMRSGVSPRPGREVRIVEAYADFLTSWRAWLEALLGTAVFALVFTFGPLVFGREVNVTSGLLIFFVVGPLTLMLDLWRARRLRRRLAATVAESES